MYSVMVFIGFIAVGMFAWFVAESLERKKNAAQVHAFDAKTRLAESRVLGLKDQLERLGRELALAKKSFDDERVAHGLAEVQFQKSLRTNMSVTGVICLAAGLAIGGAIAGLTVAAVQGAQNRHKLIRFEVMARVAESRCDFFQNQISELKGEIKTLRLQLDEERIEKTVAQTKLEMILEDRAEQRWAGAFLFNPKKGKTVWQKTDKVQPGPEPSKVLSTPVGI